MNSKEKLKEKISEISNSEFPLIDFFNDIDWLDDKRFNTEKAFEDIEKIYNVFVHYRDKAKQLEKENQGVKDDNTRLWHGLEYANNEISKLKKALDILKEKLEIQLHQDDEYFPIPMISGSEIYQNLTKEEYELLKEVLDCE